MSANTETKHWGRTVLIILAVGLLILVPLILVANHMIDEADMRHRVAVNEAAAIDTLDLIGAAEQLHLDNYGQYGTIRQLIDAGILNMSFEGEPPVFKGYAYTVRLTPKTEEGGPTYTVNADPVKANGTGATGHRHFYRGTNVTGIRFHDERPATAGDALLPRVVNPY